MGCEYLQTPRRAVTGMGVGAEPLPCPSAFAGGRGSCPRLAELDVSLLRVLALDARGAVGAGDAGLGAGEIRVCSPGAVMPQGCAQAEQGCPGDDRDGG